MDINELEAFKLSDAVKFHDELNPNLWTGNHLDPKVRKQLILIAEDFITTLGISDLHVKDIRISGSNAAYSYTPHSDLDLHILVDMEKLQNNEIYRELFTAKKTLYNDQHDITVHGVPVELYVQDINEPVVSLGEYSVLHNKWIHVPKKKRANFDEVATKAKYENLAELVDLALKTRDMDRVAKVIDTIKRYRKAGLATGGEFGPENLAYKAIRSQGGIDALYDLRDKLHSRELSIEESVETKADAIKLINKLKNTSGRSDAEAASFNAKIAELMQKYEISPDEVGMGAPVDPMKAKIAAAAYKRQQAAAALKAEWERFKRGIFAEDLPPASNSSKTQMAGTLPTYKKAADMLKKAGVKGRGLDFGAGLGLGTSELGSDVDSYEPFPGEGFIPNFVDVAEIPDNTYHRIVNLNVLNVVPNAGDERIRDSIVRNIGRVLAPGGIAIITTRGRDVLTIKGTPGEEPMSMISKIGTYQKGFTPRELKEYVQDVLGDGFEVTKINLGPAGVMIKKKESETLEEAFTEKQQVINYFIKIGKTAAQGAAAWEKGWRGSKPKPPKVSAPPAKPWLPYKDDLDEASIILSTDPDHFGATVDDTNLKKLPVVMLPLKKLVHFEPLSKMETSEAKKWVERLMSKIEKGRKIKPILVREWENGYQVLDGHHRFHAYKLLNKPEIPAQIVPDDEIETINEASGYIPSAKEKNDPRFKTALTVDVKPDAIKKNAKAFGFKTSRAGIPPQARADGKIK